MDAAPAAADAADDLPRRERRERRLLLLAWLVVAVLLVASGLYNRAETDAQERSRLAGQARAIERNVARQVEGVAAALSTLRDAAQSPPAVGQAAAAARQMAHLRSALPGLLALQWLDAQGQVVAGSGSDALSGGQRERPYFLGIRQRPDPAVLVVSPAEAGDGGAATLRLSLALTGARGAFDGVVTAILGPEFFGSVLGSVVYAEDMWAAVVHGSGVVVQAFPADPAARGMDVARPGSPFRLHVDGGQDASVVSGPSQDTGRLRLIAQHTLRHADLPLAPPLVLGVSRDSAEVFASWQRHAAAVSALCAALVLLSVSVLRLLQRRRAQLARLGAERLQQQAAAAQRVELALQGGDLALWDLHLPDARSTVNDRWYTMLGLVPGTVQADDATWQALLHPDDRERVLATMQAHLDGQSSAYESTYRLRHADGHWVWVLDRARVVERDAAGAPLRIVGTHLDVSDRVAAEQTLRRSEQSLAITLMSIGDAVIATDALGQVTRMNPTAERLTGWPAAEAVGRPLAEVFRIHSARSGLPEPDPVARVLEHGETVELVNGTVLVARGGQEYQIADSAAPIRETAADGSSRIVGVVLVFSDVTQQYRTLKTLRDREAQLSSMADALPGPVARLDRNGRYLFVNAAYERWFGVRAVDILGRGRRDVLGDGAGGSIAPLVERALAGDTVSADRAASTREGPRQVMLTLVPDRDGQGEVQGCYAVVTDISERKRIEDALRLSERKSRALLEALRSGVVLHGPDTQVLDANASACRILGLTLEQMRGRQAIDPYWKFVEEDGTPMPVERYPVNQVLRTGEPLRNLVVGAQRPDLPHVVWALCSAFALFGDAGELREVVVTFAEFTERKLAEDALRRSEARLRMTGRLARLGGWRCEAAERSLVLSAELGDLIGADAGRPVPLEGEAPAADGVAPVAPSAAGLAAALAARIGACLEGAGPFDDEIEAAGPAGRPLHLRVLGEPVLDSAGAVVAVQGAAQDITDRKRAEATLRVAQEELAATLAAVPDLLFDVDITGRIHGHHTPRSELLLVPAGDFLGRRIDEVLPAEAAEVVAAALQQAHAQGYSGGLQYELPLAGGHRWFELSVSRKPLPAGETPRFIALARDISERKQADAEHQALERQLREAQKMESIGTLAGGIAHDFNNILAAILGNAALARQDLRAGHPALASLEQVTKAGLRARSLVQQILTFSRRQPNELVGQPLRPVVEETLSLLRATLPASVRLHTALADSMLSVAADATQLQQVVMNLCTNAWHALPGGRGLIEVGLEPLAAEAAARLGLREMPSGACAHLWVRDTGVGMDEATQARIFDPFFTTKPVGQGTGLGLSVVHGIVRGHRGAILVHSAPGQGSTFHVYLPLAAPARDGYGTAGALPAAPSVGGGQHVLYVDDDEVMVLMVQRLLQRAGYRVSACTEAAHALALLQDRSNPVALLVSDYNMPEMSGIELAQTMAQQQPDLPVVISSGFISDELREQAHAVGVRALLKKENTLEELVGLVQQLLAAPGAG